MPGFMPGIHVFLFNKQDVDGRDKPGHDSVIWDMDSHPLIPVPAFAGTGSSGNPETH